MEKECNMCGEIKPYEQFSKNRTAKDGLQRHCKTCSRNQSKIFRKLNKDYYWGDKGYFRLTYDQTKQYNKIYYKADYSIKIYKIETPTGIYIGCTKSKLNVRQKDHLSDYKIYRYKKGTKKMPLFYNDLDQYKFRDCRKFFKDIIVLEEFEGDHDEKRKREAYWIQMLKNGEKPLLNKIKVYLEVR